MRRRRLLAVSLVLAVGVPSAWLWPAGLSVHRLGFFSFRAPLGIAVEPEVLDPNLSVCLLTEEPSWITSTQETIVVDGREGRIQKTSVFAPVVGYDPWAGDIRDRDVLIWC